MTTGAEPTAPRLKGRKIKSDTGRTSILHVRITPELLSKVQAVAEAKKAEGFARWSQADIVAYALESFLAQFE